jgi:hypothetical protein
MAKGVKLPPGYFYSRNSETVTDKLMHFHDFSQGTKQFFEYLQPFFNMAAGNRTFNWKMRRNIAGFIS